MPLFSTKRQGNLYKIKLSDLSSQKVSCILSVKMHHWVCHNKFGHASLRLISKQSYQDDFPCEACQKGKQVKNLFKAKTCYFHLGL